jgi:hypothetical protein
MASSVAPFSFDILHVLRMNKQLDNPYFAQKSDFKPRGWFRSLTRPDVVSTVKKLVPEALFGITQVNF